MIFSENPVPTFRDHALTKYRRCKRSLEIDQTSRIPNGLYTALIELGRSLYRIHMRR